MPIDRVLIGKHALCQSLADDSDRLGILVIESIEIAAGKDRNAQGRKKTGRDDTPLRPRSSTRRNGRVRRRKIADQKRRDASIAPGNDIAVGGLAHARQDINATYRFLVEIDDLLVCLP